MSKSTKSTRPLYKTTIVIWSEYDPAAEGFCGNGGLESLAREAERGDAYCSKMEASCVAQPETDPDWDGTEFFDMPNFELDELEQEATDAE